MAALSLMLGCDGKGHRDNSAYERGIPVIVPDTLIYNAESKTFTLNLRADSTSDATVTFFLCEGDSILQENSEGVFCNIEPNEEGYNVQARVEWSDTTIITPLRQVLGFVVPREPIEKMLISELQTLINSKDRSLSLGSNNAIAQNVVIILPDGQSTSLQDVILYLSNDQWQAVEVKGVEYDGNNCVCRIEIMPDVKPVDPIADDFDLVDEY